MVNDKFMKKIKLMMPVYQKLQDAVKLSKHHRLKIPTAVRLDLYTKIVVPAIEKYNRALVREYKKVM